MSVDTFRYRWFTAGDLNACFALMLDSMVNLAVLASVLTLGFGFPADIVYFKMIPGSTFGVFLGDMLYTWLAVRLAHKKRQQEVTAMPLGFDTPSTIGLALAVLGPAFLAAKNDLLAAGTAPAEAAQQAGEHAWHIGMAVMLMMGAFKVAFSFFGNWVQRHVPQAGLLGSIGGIGLAMLSFFPLLEIFKAPVVGLVCLGLILHTLVARIELPYRLPSAAVAVGVGTLLYYILGPLGLLGDAFHPPALQPTLAIPMPSLAGFAAWEAALPYLPLAIPFGLLTIVGGINVSESARSAGDDYNTRDILLSEALATLVAGVFGGVAQSTPYIGHPAYKMMGAHAGYTFIAGLVVGLGGALGCVGFVVGALPLAAVMPILVFVGFEITVQAFHASPRPHAPAVAFSFLPIIANLLLIRQDAFLGALAGAMADLEPAVAKAMQTVIDTALVRIDAPIVRGLGHGFILTAMLWGSFVALIIDRQTRRAAFFVLLAAIFTAFGLIHSAAPNGNLYWAWAPPSPLAWQWATGYGVLAALLLALSFTPGVRAPLRVPD